MYGYVTGMGYLSQSWRGLGDEAADTATAYSQVGISLNKDQTQSVGQLISTFQTEFPLMSVDDARWAAQAGMLQFIRPQQPAIPLSSLAAAITQLGSSATIDSVTNLADNLGFISQTSAFSTSFNSGPRASNPPATSPADIATGIALTTSTGSSLPVPAILPGPPPINPQIPAASGTVAPPPAPTNTTAVPILDTSTGNVLPPSAGQTTAVPAVPALPISAPAPSPTPSTGAPATAAAFSLCFPGDPSGPIASSVPVCTYTAIGAAIILAFFFMKK